MGINDDSNPDAEWAAKLLFTRVETPSTFYILADSQSALEQSRAIPVKGIWIRPRFAALIFSPPFNFITSGHAYIG